MTRLLRSAALLFRHYCSPGMRQLNDFDEETPHQEHYTGDSVNRQHNLVAEFDSVTLNDRYLAAATFLKEGKHYGKFTKPPRSNKTFNLYAMVRKKMFYLIDLILALALLGLAFLEKPGSMVSFDDIKIWSIVEICCLLFIVLLTGLKITWSRSQTYIPPTRSIIKIILAMLMLAQATVILTIGSWRFESILRCLRPIILLGNHYLSNVRNLARKAMHSFLKMLDILLMMFLVIGLYSICLLYTSDAADE